MRAHRAALWSIAIAALLVAAWLGFAADAPHHGSRSSAPAPAAPALPVSAAAGDPPAASPVERALATGGELTVTGRIVGARDRGVLWLGERRELGFARFTSDEGFSVRCTAPLARLHLRAVDASGAGRNWDFTRAERDASSAWDLGDIPFGGADVSVDLTLEYDPAVVQRMLGTKQRHVVVELHEERANGPLTASSDFDLASLAAQTRASSTRRVHAMLSSPDAHIVVVWACVIDQSRWGALTLKKEERLGGETGTLRSSRLELVPEQEVRGTVRFKDGEACSALEIMLMNAGAGALGCASVRAGEDGVYSFHVGSAAQGSVGLSGTIQAFIGTRQQVPVSSGTVADLCYAVDKVHFRLVDAYGVPVTSYRAGSRSAETLSPAELERDAHPDGIGWAVGSDLLEFPWLLFQLPEKKNQLFLVPAEWWAPDARSIHEVSVASFVPEGSLEVDLDGVAPASWGKTMLRLSGRAELRGFGTVLDCFAPDAGPWRIEGVPVGRYDYDTICYHRGGIRGSGEIVVSPGRTTAVRMTRH